MSEQREPCDFSDEIPEERREAAGLIQNEPGTRVFVSGAHIGLFEQGIRKPRPDVAIRIDEAPQTGGFFERTVRKPLGTSPYAPHGEPVRHRGVRRGNRIHGGALRTTRTYGPSGARRRESPHGGGQGGDRVEPADDFAGVAAGIKA